MNQPHRTRIQDWPIFIYAFRERWGLNPGPFDQASQRRAFPLWKRRQSSDGRLVNEDRRLI